MFIKIRSHHSTCCSIRYVGQTIAGVFQHSSINTKYNY